jgi:hypothetical protein
LSRISTKTSRNRIRSALPLTAPCPGMTIILQLAISTGKDRDVSTGSQQNTDVAAKRLDGDLGACSFLKSMYNEVIVFGEETSWGKTSSRKFQTSCGKELATWDFDNQLAYHLFLLVRDFVCLLDALGFVAEIE